jgi:lipoate-protein ligase A
MHGEYKMPGGKLTVVDFDVESGITRNLMVSGDFFLYPDTALESIRVALEGAPVSLSEGEFADRIRLGIEPGAELVGATPEGIAIAMRRAIDA